MKFTSPSLVNEVIWNMRLSDQVRGAERAKVNRLANGEPPYTTKEAEENNIKINMNFLDCVQLLADARRSLYNGFQSTSKFFTVSFDSGPVYKRSKWGNIITSELKNIMKGSRLYAECLDSQFASMVLHGPGPAVWPDKEGWVPEERGIEDVLIPGDTLRSLRNLDHFAVFYQYTPEQLYRLTHGPKVDKAWNMKMVDAALEWAHNQTQSQLSYSDLFAPEKVQERYKMDLGVYGTDSVPTVDFWKFYYHEDKGGEMGWRMKAVIDTPGSWEVGGKRPEDRPMMPKENLVGMENGQWLYDPGDRVYASNIEQLIHFQFCDLSAVSPFHYHSIRALGWLLYSICFIQNRILCKFNEAVLENMMQFFRCNEQDKTRTQMIDLHHFGVVPDGVAFVRPEERWQVNAPLIENAIDRNRERMEYSAAQYRQGQDQGGDTREKTATQVMAEVNSAMSMVGTMLTQAYRYQAYQYREIARRFCIENSSDPDVRKFRVNVLKKGVPEKMLNSDLWQIEPEKVLGGGNATLKLAMADSLMQMRPFLDPESQRLVDRINIAAKTDNDDLAERLVPEIKAVSNSAHDAATGFASMMLGVRVPPETGTNHVDAIETLLAAMATLMHDIEMTGAMASPDQLKGLQNVAQHVQEHLQILGQNPAEKERVRQYSDELGQLENLLKAYAQRLQEAQQKAAQANGQGQPGPDPQAMAKAQSAMMLAQLKAKNAATAHAQKTAQRDLSFQREQMRKDQEHALEMRRKLIEVKTETAAKDLTTAAEIRRGGLKSTKE